MTEMWDPPVPQAVKETREMRVPWAQQDPQEKRDSEEQTGTPGL